MFTELFTEFLPLVGEFFGKICGIAMYRMDVLLSNIEHSYTMTMNGVPTDVLFTYGNFFIGDGFSDLSHYVGVLLPSGLWSIPILSTILYNGVLTVLSLLTFVTPNAPLWIALPVGFAAWGFILSIIKFFKGMVQTVISP